VVCGLEFFGFGSFGRLSFGAEFRTVFCCRGESWRSVIPAGFVWCLLVWRVVIGRLLLDG
jgi:hypothetical protein